MDAAAASASASASARYTDARISVALRRMDDGSAEQLHVLTSALSTR
jgi:hypothetical protein